MNAIIVTKVFLVICIFQNWILIYSISSHLQVPANYELYGVTLYNSLSANYTFAVFGKEIRFITKRYT